MSKIPETRSILNREHFKQILAELQPALVSGKLIHLPNNSPFSSDVDVNELNADGPWPDIIISHYRAAVTGQLYKLFVDIYHGRWGSWSEVDEIR